LELALVTGILGTSDPKAIEAALASQSIDTSKLKVVTKSVQSPEYDDSILDFVEVIDSQSSNDISDDMTKGTGVLSDSGGTGVPGIGSRGPSLASIGGSGGPSPNYLGNIRIPGDQKDNYNDAIDDGRSVVVYDGDNAPSIEAAFKAAGLRNVRVF
jgi:hypothetical protein